MGKYLLKLVISEVLALVAEAIRDYFKYLEKSKEDKKKVKDALKESDAQTRASRISDLLNS